MKTLIITVGTRQIGWKCHDGLIRCFGIDGGRNDPKHTDELYQELGIERGFYQEGERTYPWSVRDLGERYYEYCREQLGGDYQNIQLLIDNSIIIDYAKNGLDHVILWGTNQPDSVSWNYRRLDTLWLAKLMKEKINSLYPTLEVDVFDPVVNVNDLESIRYELQEYILKFAINRVKNHQDSSSQFTLLIENKGAAPAISENLAVYAAGLVRQYPVSILNPIPPEPLYEVRENNQLSSQPSLQYQITSLETYFFPLEKVRIISAWKRGDFDEARIWLEAHQSHFEVVYKLSRWLALAMNGELDEFMSKIKQWMQSNSVRQTVRPEQIEEWNKQIEKLRQSQYFQTLESYFILQNLLERKNYTNAFLLFAQMLERILSLKLAKDLEFIQLIDQWNQQFNHNKKDKWWDILHKIRQERNRVVHQGQSITFPKFRSIWSNNKFAFPDTENAREILKHLHQVLHKVYGGNQQEPSNTFCHSLGHWGLNYLQSN